MFTTGHNDETLGKEEDWHGIIKRTRSLIKFFAFSGASPLLFGQPLLLRTMRENKMTDNECVPGPKEIQVLPALQPFISMC